MVIEQAPLEDELGDVLDKAMRLSRIDPAALATLARVSEERILDALDYRYEDLAPAELERLADALALAPAGLRELASGRYPLPVIAGLPFCLHPLRTPHGLGTANAYLVTDCRGGEGVLFDTGPDPQRLRRMWPAHVTRLAAVFLTHAETEHTGALDEVRRLFGPVPVFAPKGAAIPGATGLADGARIECGAYAIETLATPGHAEAHNAYLVRPVRAPAPHATPLLVSGDLLFAGSIGGAYYCVHRHREQISRILRTLPSATVLAPGHGPLTTVSHELAHNPFAPLTAPPTAHPAAPAPAPPR
jgi:glyoxylase-like metal-dependent hydrolase (beta-lactamase superfamily II)